MEVQSLGYVGVGAADLSDWTDFATNWLGMQMVERGNAARAFRMDDRKQRLIVDRSLADGRALFRLGGGGRGGARCAGSTAGGRPAWRCGANPRRWRTSVA